MPGLAIGGGGQNGCLPQIVAGFAGALSDVPWKVCEMLLQDPVHLGVARATFGKIALGVRSGRGEALRILELLDGFAPKVSSGMTGGGSTARAQGWRATNDCHCCRDDTANATMQAMWLRHYNGETAIEHA